MNDDPVPYETNATVLIEQCDERVLTTQVFYLDNGGQTVDREYYDESDDYYENSSSSYSEQSDSDSPK